MLLRNEMVMQAPVERIFELTSNLDHWVPNLPHYRFIHYLARSEDGLDNQVKMACWCGWIPLSWVSRHEIKPELREVHFTHLRAFTKGMTVIWRYEAHPNGVLVSITHDLNFRIRWMAPVMNWIIGRCFIHPVATKTLETFKRLLDARS
jgi:hypothetical protein